LSRATRASSQSRTPAIPQQTKRYTALQYSFEDPIRTYRPVRTPGIPTPTASPSRKKCNTYHTKERAGAGEVAVHEGGKNKEGRNAAQPYRSSEVAVAVATKEERESGASEIEAGSECGPQK